MFKKPAIPGKLTRNSGKIESERLSITPKMAASCRAESELQFQAIKLPYWFERYETKTGQEITEPKMSRILSIHESIYLSKHLFF
jgi:phage gpG-like protein